jgi:hypothetical protein
MKRSFFPAVALIGLLGWLGGPAARAQAPTIAPPTTTAPVFPINQPQTFRYTDADGMGTITEKALLVRREFLPGVNAWEEFAPRITNLFLA